MVIAGTLVAIPKGGITSMGPQSTGRANNEEPGAFLQTTKKPWYSKVPGPKPANLLLLRMTVYLGPIPLKGEGKVQKQ
jgi:hypothetical protein